MAGKGKGTIIDFAKEAAKRGRSLSSTPTPTVSQVIENGSYNTQISGKNNKVQYIKTEKVIQRPKITVQPGHEVISEAQKVVLQGLVKEIADIESLLKKRPVTHGGIWGATNKKAGVSSYHLIPVGKFTVVETYLRQWIGRLNSGKTAPKKDNDSWRKRHYAYIKINVKKLDLEDKLISHLSQKYGVTSLTELGDSDLKSVYLAVAGWKQRTK
jgi:hypothetical protein